MKADGQKNDGPTFKMSTSRVTQKQPRYQYTACGLLLWLHAIFSTIISISGAQVILPGRNPRIYLATRCAAFTVSGLDEGTILSHANSARYRPNTDCTVSFGVGPGHVVRFDFERFGLQKKVRGRCVDYVQFFAGGGRQVALTEPLCGETPPGPVSLTNASQVAVHFHSNARYEAAGFAIRFRRSEVPRAGLAPNCDEQPDGSTDWRRLGRLIRVPVIFLLFPMLLVGILLYKHFS